MKTQEKQMHSLDLASTFAQLRFSKHISGLMSVCVNDYLGNKHCIFSYNKARLASESDTLVNSKKVFCSLLS